MTRLSDRERLVAHLEARHIGPAFPRAQLSLMLAVSGLVGFLTSVGLLSLGVDRMWLRYPLAVAVAYLALLLVLRLWIAWHRGELSVDPDVWPWDAPAGSPEPAPAMRGGASGGGGGGASWDDAPRLVDARGGGSASGHGGRFSWDLDLDEAWWLLVAAVVLFGGALTVVYVIYIAPVLLAEVAIDAALVTTVYRRLRPHDVRHWSVGVVRRTWAAAVVLALCLAGAGLALHQIAPDARSIGAVVAHLRS